jgi:predicted enzyme related to lactoylglutathione lyase
MPVNTAAKSRGRFVWFDLATTDPAAAITFYTKLIGWETEVWPGEMPYTMWTANKTPLGGVMSLPPDAMKAGASPHWIAHITTPHVDESAATATRLGGRVLVPPTDIPTVGRFAMLADPQGAIFSAFAQENPTPEREGPVLVGDFMWQELNTSDAVAAFDFYHAIFGWEHTSQMDMGEHGIYYMYGRNDEVLGGMYTLPPSDPRPSAWLHYIRVPDVDRSALQIPKLGGKVTLPAMDVPNGSRVLHGTDPQGGPFALVSAR